MLILTSAAAHDPVTAGLPGAWPGPCAFVALPGHGLGRAGLRAAEAEAVVVEALEPPDGAGALLCEIARRLPWLLRAPGPLRLAAAPGTAATLAADRDRALAGPLRIEAEWDGDGALAGLLVGAAAMAHPLAAPTLAEAAGRPLGEAALLRLLAAVTGATLAARPPGPAHG